jgi:hypothetical protein
VKTKYIVIVVCIVILAACAPSADAVSTAIAQTQAAQPTPTVPPTPTRIPLDEINLEELLIMPGDLPTDFEGQQVKSELSPTLKAIEIPEGINMVSQAFRNGDWASEGVTIVLYKSAEEAEKHFTDKLNTDLPEVEGLGERSLISEGGTLCEGCAIQIIFIRCNALVFVDVFDQLRSRDTVYEIITTYAKRLDTRLQPLVCEN